MRMLCAPQSLPRLILSHVMIIYDINTLLLLSGWREGGKEKEGLGPEIQVCPVPNYKDAWPANHSDHPAFHVADE